MAKTVVFFRLTFFVLKISAGSICRDKKGKNTFANRFWCFFLEPTKNQTNKQYNQWKSKQFRCSMRMGKCHMHGVLR